MARPLRIEFPGAVYHVTARGDRREAIFLDDDDRALWLRTLAEALARFDATVLAFCLMGNHFHLVLCTRQANLSRLMRQLNGVYTQRFNRRHGKTGHVFQGRFKAIVVDREAYLAEVCRYVDLNPVRAGLVDDPAAWRWSSCRLHLGLDEAPPWLDSASVLGLGTAQGPAPHADADVQRARARYAAHLAAGRGVTLWPQALQQQIYLGDADFVARMQTAARAAAAGPARPAGGEIPREQLRAPGARERSLTQWLAEGPSRAQALRRAHEAGGWTLTAMARELGLSVSRVSRLVARAGQEEQAEPPGQTAPGAP